MKDNSLELKHLMNENTMKINYYPILCTNIQNENGNIHCIYRGDVNEPNIVLNKKTVFPENYQASELFVFKGNEHKTRIPFDIPNIPTIPTSEFYGTLFVKHTPINVFTISKLYSCFLLYKKKEKTKNSDSLDFMDSLDVLMNGKQEWVELNLFPYVSKSKSEVYENKNSLGENTTILFFENPIPITITTVSIDTSTPPHSSHLPMTPPPSFPLQFSHSTPSPPPPPSSFPPLPMVESFVTTDVSGNMGYLFSNDNNNTMECEYIPGGNADEIAQFYEVPLQSNAFLNSQNNKDTMVAIYTIYCLFFFLVIAIVFPFIWNKLIDNVIGYPFDELQLYGYLSNNTTTEKFKRAKKDWGPLDFLNNLNYFKFFNNFGLYNVRMFDFIIFIIFFIISITLLSVDGNNNKIAGTMLIVVYVMCVISTIIHNRYIRPEYENNTSTSTPV